MTFELFIVWSIRPRWLSWMRVRLETRRSRVRPRRGRQHSFVEIDHEIFSSVILSLPLIQEGQLSVSGERMCTGKIEQQCDSLTSTARGDNNRLLQTA